MNYFIAHAHISKSVWYIYGTNSHFSSSTGSLPPMVDPGEGGPLFPDVQFWKQCADPVLAQDPFSSLMSTLFCLPVQFLSSAEFFIPFVHLFYVVCAVQVCLFALLSLGVCSLYVVFNLKHATV